MKGRIGILLIAARPSSFVRRRFQLFRNDGRHLFTLDDEHCLTRHSHAWHFRVHFLSPLYVAVITYHYEVIPSALLLTIGESRSRVPFPPVIEALFLEFMIELLREAGARLPTKVGQTMGIVGGIVLGQAAVDAGFTSNVLIIIVALSALGSFTAPSYEMGATIRILRFPIILLAALWGLVGIFIGVSLLLIHLLKLTSLGRPYLSPIYPFRFTDMKYALIRLPIKFYDERPKTNRPQNSRRFHGAKR